MSYAPDRLVFSSNPDGSYTASVDGVEIANLSKVWSRVGGWGWIVTGTTGQTFPTRKQAVRQALQVACQTGLIVNEK